MLNVLIAACHLLNALQMGVRVKYECNCKVPLCTSSAVAERSLQRSLCSWTKACEALHGKVNQCSVHAEVRDCDTVHVW